jgi:hypothetical protein
MKCTERISCEDTFDKTLSLTTGRAYGHEDLKNLLATSDITVGGKAFTISKYIGVDEKASRLRLL